MDENNITFDIVFLDPPYNSRDYGQYYHVLEQIVKWDKPELFGKTAKPKGIVKSEYCSNSATKTFEELIEDLKAGRETSVKNGPCSVAN